jgi:cytidylate kinase
MSVYPKNVGNPIIPTSFSLEQTWQLKDSLPKNLIIRIYGLSGVGKGTVSDKLAEVLAIPSLNTGLIWRAITFLALDRGIEPTTTQTQEITDNLTTGLDLDGLNFVYEGKKLTISDLKNNLIDKEVFKFAQNQILRDLFDQILTQIVLDKGNTPIISDGRGSHEPYLVEAEKRGYQIIRILVDCNLEVKTQRYFLQYAKSHPDFHDSPEVHAKLLEQFKKDIFTRDEQDVANIVAKNLGLISEDTAILDNSYLNPEQTLQSALAYIQSRV